MMASILLITIENVLVFLTKHAFLGGIRDQKDKLFHVVLAETMDHGPSAPPAQETRRVNLSCLSE
jgi:hypothetical protein